MHGLRVTGLAKAFAGVPALAGVTLDVRPGRVHCLVGGNGSGKSTLIKILAGVYSADAGEVTVGGETIAAQRITPHWARRAGIGFVHQDPAVFPDLTVAENLVAGRGFPHTALGRVERRTLHARAAELIDRFHLEARPSTTVGALRPAQRTMVAIARALSDHDRAGGVLVLDEPTAALPVHEATFLLDTLRRYAAAGQTIIFVSHRLEEVLHAGDDVSVLRDGRLVATAPAGDLTRTRLIELVAGHAVAAAVPAGEPPRANGDPVALELRGLRSGPLGGVDLAVAAGEIVGVAGLLGSGRSQLLRAAFGVAPVEAGAVAVDGRVMASGDVRGAMRAGVAYLPEDRDHEAIFGELSVRENLSATHVRRYWRGLRFSRAIETADASASMAAFRIRARSDGQPVATLSGGNRQKVVLARWMRTAPRVLLLDEPTQGVDVGARAEIHALIASAARGGAAALVVSSDFEELEQLCDRVVVLARGRLTAELRRPRIDARLLSELSFDVDEVIPAT